MEVITQAPQPTIKCYQSVRNDKWVGKILYQIFSPGSSDLSGANLQSYNFERSLDNFGGSFSFTVKEDINNSKNPFMDAVCPLDIIEISESGSEKSIDFIGVVTSVSLGGIASNLNKVVTVSGHSIEWLFQYYNINADIKGTIFNKTSANNFFKIDLASGNGTSGISIKDMVKKSYDYFNDRAFKIDEVSNVVIGAIIKHWYGSDFVVADNEKFYFPISSNLFSDGKINFIDFVKRLLPSPIYEVYGKIEKNKPKLCARKVPFDLPKANYSINPALLTDFTLTRTCDEVYTAFMPYIEGAPMSPNFYMNIKSAQGLTEHGYDSAVKNSNKVGVYGYQLLTSSFIGYTPDSKNEKESTVAKTELKKLADNLSKWFGNLDDMYNGDFTLVNLPDKGSARVGEWVSFATGLFYITTERHYWSYGDNPMVNYQVTRGGKYANGNFTKLDKLSTMYREFENDNQ